MFLQHLAERLLFSCMCDKSYGHVLMWIWVRLAFAVIWATNLYLRELVFTSRMRDLYCGVKMVW